ncbi:MAG TPA: type II toxin-antitoxin system VapC family toxin [Ottowia sp.]|nr:type II toxin-antitoxin system VapC family toxin [Ottowia sp.]
MRLPDTNVLLYAVNRHSPQNAVAHDWLERSAREPQGMAMVWVTLVGFIRLATRAAIVPEPLSVERALAQVQQWLDHPVVHLLQPGARHMDILARLLLEAGTAGNLTSDAHIAAIAIEHNAEVLTFDKDFARFSGLRYQILS